MFSRLAIVTIAVAVFAAACSSSGGGSTQGVQGATNAPAATDTSGSAASATTASGGGSGSATIMTAQAGGKTVLVAGSNGMTVYTFTHDTANSGKSACSGGCLAIWPAVTVPSGSQPTAGSGVSGKLGTITRDDGTIQVTYNGLPLYFYQKDSKPGDTLGSYPSWNLVTP